mmetsp:Transcript_52089/g.126276  ORF Transcript_52089/g.126276 Transcript_52089/m.126276 type:complete len:212 (+) Transcript_52089:271-906(+)
MPFSASPTTLSLPFSAVASPSRRDRARMLAEILAAERELFACDASCWATRLLSACSTESTRPVSAATELFRVSPAKVTFSCDCARSDAASSPASRTVRFMLRDMDAIAFCCVASRCLSHCTILSMYPCSPPTPAFIVSVRLRLVSTSSSPRSRSTFLRSFSWSPRTASCSAPMRLTSLSRASLIASTSFLVVLATPCIRSTASSPSRLTLA